MLYYFYKYTLKNETRSESKTDINMLLNRGNKIGKTLLYIATT
jgi:hypothetical protein